MYHILRRLNEMNTKCTCKGCYKAERFFSTGTRGEEVECTFSPWLDNVLKERGFVVLRETSHPRDGSIDVTDDTPFRQQFAQEFNFSDKDCHLVETPEFQYNIPSPNHKVDPYARWGGISVGKRLWDVETVDNQWVTQFEEVFGTTWKPLASPPTPMPSPTIAPVPPPQPSTLNPKGSVGLSIEARVMKEIAIKKGSELQTAKEQLAAQAAELQALKEQLEIQGLELKMAKEKLATQAAEALKEQGVSDIGNKRARPPSPEVDQD